MIREVTIKFFGRGGGVKVFGFSGKEISFKKILGMRLRTLGVKQKKDDFEREIEVYLELEK